VAFDLFTRAKEMYAKVLKPLNCWVRELTRLDVTHLRSFMAFTPQEEYIEVT